MDNNKKKIVVICYKENRGDEPMWDKIVENLCDDNNDYTEDFEIEKTMKAGEKTHSEWEKITGINCEKFYILPIKIKDIYDISIYNFKSLKNISKFIFLIHTAKKEEQEKLKEKLKKKFNDDCYSTIFYSLGRNTIYTPIISNIKLETDKILKNNDNKEKLIQVLNENLNKIITHSKNLFNKLLISLFAYKHSKSKNKFYKNIEKSYNELASIENFHYKLKFDNANTNQLLIVENGTLKDLFNEINEKLRTYLSF